MCRLYGFIANERTKVECTLVHAQNALLLQSRSDEIGRAHADGWGIGYFRDQDEVPHLEKSAAAAYEGLHFSNTAERVYSKTVVSHIRLATVGSAIVENSHPFSWGHWVFAHNGTVAGIEYLRQELRFEVSESHRASILGETDSELLFHWLLHRAYSYGAIEYDRCVSLERLCGVIAGSILELDERCAAVSPSKPARLNIVLTDGHCIIASRFRNSLSWVHRNGIRDCEICGIPHVEHSPQTNYRAVVIASEALSHEDWREIPDGSLLSVDRNLQTKCCPIASIASNASRV